MEALTYRLLPYEVHDGPHNMAADEALLTSAAAGVASLRFYGWTTATVSLGYFQSYHELDSTPELRNLPLVRRATGGMTLVHHHELTYCVALPPSHSRTVGNQWLDVHGLIAGGLAVQGVVAHTHPLTSPHFGPLCFEAHTTGDLLIGAQKVVGSAQRKSHGAIMQHGGILLAQSAYTPSLLGVLELTGIRVNIEALMATIADYLGAARGDWTAAERALTDRLAREKYASAAWTHKR